MIFGGDLEEAWKGSLSQSHISLLEKRFVGRIVDKIYNDQPKEDLNLK